METVDSKQACLYLITRKVFCCNDLAFIQAVRPEKSAYSLYVTELHEQ